MKPSITFPVNELKTALTGISKVIQRKPTLPVLGHIRVTRNSTGIVTMQATDLDTTVVFQSNEMKQGPACDFLVPYEPLNKLVRGSKDPVILSIEGKSSVRITSVVGSSPMEQVVETVPVAEYPAAPKIDGTSIPVDATFRDRLREALECCSQDESRHIIQHACVDTRYADGHYITGTNGSHLFCANSFKFDLKEPVMIPDRDFLRWKPFMQEGNGELSVSTKGKDDVANIQLKSGPWTFITRSCAGSFPNWKQVVPPSDDANTRVLFSDSAVATLLAGVPKLPSYSSEMPVRIVIDAGTVVFQGRTQDSKDWTELKVDGVTITGNPVITTVNRQYLLKALRFGLNTVEIKDSLSPLLFSESGRRMVVMPLRSNDTPVPTTPSVTVPPISTPPVTKPEPQSTPQPTTPPTESNQEAKETKMTKEAPTTEATVETPIRQAIQQIDTIKETLKSVMAEITGLNNLLRQIEKDKRASEKEVELVREKLREIQSVKI